MEQGSKYKKLLDAIMSERLGLDKAAGIPYEEAAKKIAESSATKFPVEEIGSRMATSDELGKLAARKRILEKMSGKAASKLGKSGLSRAAGLALGPLGLLASEGADAAELGPQEGSRDAIIESPIDAESKKMLLDKLDRKEKILDPSYLNDLGVMSNKVDDIMESNDTRSEAQKEKDAETNLRKEQILRGLRLR